MKKLSQIRITQTGEMLAIDADDVAKPIAGTVGELIAAAAADAGLDPDGALIEPSFLCRGRVAKEGKGFRVEPA